MQKSKKLIILALGLGMLASCKKKDDDATPATIGNYIIAATPEGSLGEGADYVLANSTLNDGKISVTGNGIEQDGYRYYTFHKNKVFSLLYGQGNPGAVTTYHIDAQGKLAPFSNLVTETVQVFGTVKDDVLLIKCPRSGIETASMFRVNADNPSIVGTKTVNVVQLAKNGERAHFTGAFQVDNKVYAPYMCIKGKTGEVFHTNFTDSTWIAVFSYPELELERVIKDNRTGYIGYYFAQSGLQQVENGDVYAFSSAVNEGVGVVPSTKPSAAIKINKGGTAFDQSYFFNIQEKSGGRHLYNAAYCGNNKFLLTMYDVIGKTSGNKSYAIVDVVSQSYTPVTGLPAPADITHVGRLPHVSKDKATISLGITTTADGPYIYRIDVNAAKATRGLQVEAGSITAIGELN